MEQHQCGVKNNNGIECNKKAEYIATGYAAMFGVPLKTFFCKDCMDEWIKKHPDTMNEVIMEYNSFKVKFEHV